jgi:hypothetical protein
LPRLDEAAGLCRFGPAVEVIEAEDAIELAPIRIWWMMVRIGGECADRFFDAAEGAQAIKLQLEILADFGATPFSRLPPPTFHSLRAHGQQHPFPGRFGNVKP